MKGMTKTKYPNVYYYVSEKKRYDGKPDMCFYYSYNEQVPGTEPGKTKWVKKNVKVGWRSEKITAAFAAEKLSEFLTQRRNGEAPTPARQAKGLTYEEGYALFKEVWFPNLKDNGFDIETRYKNHIGPRFGKRYITQITPLELEEYKTELLRNGLAAASVRHILGDMRNVYNKLKKWGKFKGDAPFEQVQMPKVDNARTRFLSQEEAEKLLTTLNARSRQWFLIATISLNTGARLGEIVGTTIHDLHMGNRVWQIKGKTGRRTITINEAAFRAFEEGLNTRQNIIAFPKKAVDEATADLIARETGLCISDVYYVHLGCIDLERGIITYTRRNSSKPKTYPITKAIWGIVKECVDKRSSELVFPSKEGTLILPGATATFKRAAVECGLNHKKVAPLDKVVFHTLRHTYCSWEAQKGTPLFKIARLVGHKTTAMTERYSHLCPETESQQLIRQDNAAEQLSAILTSLAGKTSESVPQAVLDWVASLESKAPGAS